MLEENTRTDIVCKPMEVWEALLEARGGLETQAQECRNEGPCSGNGLMCGFPFQTGTKIEQHRPYLSFVIVDIEAVFVSGVSLVLSRLLCIVSDHLKHQVI